MRILLRLWVTNIQGKVWWLLPPPKKRSAQPMKRTRTTSGTDTLNSATWVMGAWLNEKMHHFSMHLLLNAVNWHLRRWTRIAFLLSKVPFSSGESPQEERRGPEIGERRHKVSHEA